VGFYSSFFKLKAKSDADSLLLKICHLCRFKKIAEPLQHNVTKTHETQECGLSPSQLLAH
jgi:hypothetical protein